MCGRYVRRLDKQKLAEAFHLGKLPPDFVLAPDYNVAPKTPSTSREPKYS
jgi:putative SOS response-associated peptidase YedK